MQPASARVGNEAWANRVVLRPRTESFRDGLRGKLALAAILVVALYSGFVGIDFGRHWDEPERLGTVIHAVERGELLPNWYNYPSVVHDLIVASAAPALLRLDVLP